MPRHASPKKALRKTRRQNLRNKMWKSRVKTAVKAVKTAESGQIAEKNLKEAFSILDKAARHRIIHPNAAGRLKSHLAKFINQKTVAQTK